MRRTSIAILALCLLTGQTATNTPDDLLQRGRDEYGQARYADAVKDLGAATEGFLASQEMQTYVNTGRFEALPKFETAVVYLAMAHLRLGQEDEAREQIRRLAAAERIAPTYASLPLGADVAGFDQIIQRLAPGTTLPANTALAALPPVPMPLPAPQPAIAEERTAQMRALEERIAAARAEAQREAEQKIAAARAEIEKQTQERIAAAQREADLRVAAARAEIERQTQQRIAAERAAVERPTPTTPAGSLSWISKAEDSMLRSRA